MTDNNKHEALFNAIRQDLGVKRLFHGTKELVLNGEIGITDDDNVPWEVRDHDGITVLARDNGESLVLLCLGVGGKSKLDAPIPSVLVTEEESLVCPYRTFHYTDDQCLARLPLDNAHFAFFKALNVPLVYVDKWGEEVTLIHPQLVAHWRDLVRLDANPQWKELTGNGLTRSLTRDRLMKQLQYVPKPPLVRSEELVSDRKRSRSPDPAEVEHSPKRPRLDDDDVNVIVL